MTGASGMLGRAWCELLTARGVAFDAATRQELDLTDAASIEAGVRPEHATIINCAAWTDVDGAEAEADEARATEVNGRGVERLLRRAEEVGARVVHYSTDYVFDGAARAPYGTDHPPAPINAYGRSKRVGEAAMHAAARAAAARGAAPAHLLIRTSWLYAPWGRSFVCTIAGLAREREELRVVADQRGRPTSAEHLAATSLALLERGASGTYHVTDGGQCTWFELAEVVAAEVAPRCRVVACTTADMPRPARRPAWSVLDLTRTEALLGPMPPWQSNVRGVVARLPTQ